LWAGEKTKKVLKTEKIKKQKIKKQLTRKENGSNIKHLMRTFSITCANHGFGE
jgi:Mor family transcriptional regulator